MVPLLMYVCVTFYGEMANTNLLFMIPQVICIMVGVLVAVLADVCLSADCNV